MNLKALYQRFRAWQQASPTFECKSTTSHICANCGNTYEGDFCPVCGQRYDIGKATWSTILRDFKFKNGVEITSVISFVLQMLARPGYLISNFIKGHRQICGDPLSVLCVVALFSILMTKLFGGSGDAQTAVSLSGDDGILGFIVGWMSSHLEWAMIIETALLIFPTWLLFRFAPKHNHHTFADGFYIQLFMGSLVLFFVALRGLVGKWIVMFIPIYYFIAFHQLFGYGIWGTFWRTLLCLGIIFYFFGVSMMVSLHISGEFWAQHTAWEFLSMFGAFLLLGAGLLFLGYWISKKTERKPIE